MMIRTLPMYIIMYMYIRLEVESITLEVIMLVISQCYYNICTCMYTGFIPFGIWHMYTYSRLHMCIHVHVYVHV